MRFVIRCLKQLAGLGILFLVIMLTSYHDTLTNHSVRSIRHLAQYYANISQRYSMAGGPLSDEPKKKFTPTDVFENRRLRVQEVCNSTRKVPGRVRGVYTHDKSGVIYCFVPKAGCTFWKRVFNFLNDEKINSSYQSPFSIPRHLVHNLHNGKGYSFDLHKHNPRKYPTRLIVTRDPISRILSSYLDKLYLPDFWKQNGISFMKMAHAMSKTQIVTKNGVHDQNAVNKIGKNKLDKNLTQVQESKTREQSKLASTNNELPDLKHDFLRSHFDNMAMKFNASFNPKISSTSTDVRCGKYLTFSEFATTSLHDFEPHWVPIHQLCNPCQFFPTHLSRMDTFTKDARVILSSMGLADILDNFDTNAQTKEELSMLVEYHFTRAFDSKLKRFYAKCLSSNELAYRLWQNFKWRGYIHPDVNYVIPEFTEEKNVKKDLMAQIWHARDLGLKEPSVMKKAKVNFVKLFYSSLSLDVFNKLVQRYELDVKLFGYENIVNEMHQNMT